MKTNQKLFFILSVCLFSACSADRYYFNKRIDHVSAEPIGEQTAPPFAGHAGLEYIDVYKGAGTKVCAEEQVPVLIVPAGNQVGGAIEPQPRVLLQRTALAGKKIFAALNPVRSARLLTENIQERIKRKNPGSALASADATGILVVLTLILFFFTFFISLGMGYTVGQAALYALGVLAGVGGCCCCCH